MCSCVFFLVQKAVCVFLFCIYVQFTIHFTQDHRIQIASTLSTLGWPGPESSRSGACDVSQWLVSINTNDRWSHYSQIIVKIPFVPMIHMRRA